MSFLCNGSINSKYEYGLITVWWIKRVSIKIITQNLKVSFIMLGHRLCYYPYPHGSVTGRDFIPWTINFHYNDVIMCPMASQITGLAIVYSIVHLSADQRKHQSSALLAFVKGIHWRPVNSPHKGPVSRKMFLFDDVIMPVIMTSIICVNNASRSVIWVVIFRGPCQYKDTVLPVYESPL